MIKFLKKTFTLAEVLLAAFVLLVIGAVLVSLVASSSIALERTRSSFILSSHASSVFENMKSFNRTNLYSKRDDQQYWLDLMENRLINQTLIIRNINESDTMWLDDPLGIELELQWDMRGHRHNETYLTYFTF